MCFIFLHLKTYICRHACHCDSSVSSVSSFYVAVPLSLMVFFILTGGCVLPKNCARSTSCCQAFTGTAGQYYYHAAFGFHESCQIKILFCQVSVRVYFRKLCESDFGFWGFGILGDFAGGCESGRSSTFLEPRSTPGSFTYSPRVSSCKVNNSSKVIFFWQGELFSIWHSNVKQGRAAWAFICWFSCAGEKYSHHQSRFKIVWQIPSPFDVQNSSNSYLISTEGALRRPMTYDHPVHPSHAT